jgi:hypothetical protein
MNLKGNWIEITKENFEKVLYDFANGEVYPFIVLPLTHVGEARSCDLTLASVHHRIQLDHVTQHPPMHHPLRISSG